MHPGWRPRLVATDLDGTLLRTGGTVSEFSISVLQEVVDSGVTLVVVTGRPLRWVQSVREWLPAGSLLIVSNGAGVIDVATGELVQTDCISCADAARVIELIAGHVPDAAFAVELSNRFLRDAGYRTAYDDVNPATVVKRDDLVAEPVLKLLVRSQTKDSDELLAAAAEVVPGTLATLTHSTSGAEGLIEISAAGIDKGAALAELCGRLGIPAGDVAVFGDMPNDVSMLAWAGRGFAVAGAHPRARSAADEIIGSNDDDAVARTLSTLLEVAAAR